VQGVVKSKGLPRKKGKSRIRTINDGGTEGSKAEVQISEPRNLSFEVEEEIRGGQDLGGRTNSNRKTKRTKPKGLILCYR
jgi:hypothetical protein